MELAQKKRIIKRNLKEISENPLAMALPNDTEEAMRQFKVAPVAIQLLVPQAQKDRLSLINPLAELEDELTQEYNALMDQPKVTVTIPPPSTIVALEALQEGITVTKIATPGVQREDN